MNTVFLNKNYTTGRIIKVGETLNFKALATSFQWKTFAPKKLTVVSPFPAISTQLCDQQTQGISKLAAKYQQQVDFLTLSVDLPFTLKEWCGAHSITNVETLSDYNNHSFGKASGFLIDELKILNRGVIIVDANKKVLFVSANDNVHEQIDFDTIDQKLEQFLSA